MIAAPSSHLPEGIVRYPVPSHFDQAKHHHPIDVISTKRSARRNLPSSLPTGGDFSFPIISSVKPPFPRTNLHIHPFYPENHPFSGRTTVFSPRAEEQVAAADSRRRHWLPKREGAHEVGRTVSGYCRCKTFTAIP